MNCGEMTGRFCDGDELLGGSPCLARDHIPSETWLPGQRTPFCGNCEDKLMRCRFCRRIRGRLVQGCTPPAHDRQGRDVSQASNRAAQGIPPHDRAESPPTSRTESDEEEVHGNVVESIPLPNLSSQKVVPVPLTDAWCPRCGASWSLSDRAPPRGLSLIHI